ncbi:MAG: CoA transferase [Caulobacteraceae bacterium]|nr:CoA transferase [Caulobacteraceae bacterium]
MNQPTVFDGLKVVDLTHGFAGALTTMIMADNGAAVTRIEPPEGCGYRGEPNRDSAGLRQWRRGKARLVLDLKTPAGIEPAKALVREADVLVAAFRPGVLERLGLGYEALAADNPRLVYCAITGFGPRGKYRDLPGYEGVVMALAGRMVDFGSLFNLDRPAFTAPPMAGFGASQAALQGICAALHERRRSGQGQKVETSLLQAFSAYEMGAWLAVQLADKFPQLAFGPPSGKRPVDPNPGQSLQYMPVRTRDGGWLQFANFAPHLFWLQMEMLGLGHLKDDPHYAGLPMAAPLEVRNEVAELILKAVRQFGEDEFMQKILASGQVGADRFGTTQAGMDHPQIRHNRHVVTLDDPEFGPIEQLGALAQMSATPSLVDAPRPVSPSPAASPAASAAKAASGRGGALEDVVVIEAAAMYAAPFGPSLLADLGARVIKVEPLEGDLMRKNGFLGFKAVQDKESIALDLKQPEAQAIVHKLIAGAQLFMHNYRPGAPARLGLDYEALKAANPSIVYLYAGAYGADGPYVKLPAYHPIAGAVCGNAVLQAGQGYPPPPEAELDMAQTRAASRRLINANEGNPDVNAAMVVGSAMLLGLTALDRHGLGQSMVTTMLGANAYAMSDDWIRYPGKPERPLVDSELNGVGPLYRLYRTADGWVFLAVTNDDEWRRLLETEAGARLRGDGQFATAAGRAECAAALAETLAAAFAERSADAWEDSLLPAGVACVRADRGGYAEFLHADPHVRENGYRVDVRHAELGPHWRPSPTVTLSRTPARVGAASAVGEHTRAILEELGYSTAEIDDLAARKVIYCAPAQARA